jgi:two-component system sensor histidine kinase KdpD
MVENLAPEERRPSPEDMLEVAEEEERKTHDGQLIIYLGYAAGVGKTYTMLQDALEWRKEGVDVVIGYVETHGRPETDALAARFEMVPPIRTEYQGLQLVEMDTDTIIQRRPKMVLVDELAHTNVPGMRHPKRFQDVIDLLHEGISVCTTVNIQHVESLNDSVAQITGIRMMETVPDTVFSAADMIRLIDLPTEELQGRLRAGKVYVQDMAEQAIERFFSTPNLLALRQIALRYVAQITDRRMITQMRARAIPGPWPAGERLLVGIRPGPTADQMVRAAYKLADRFQADWIVLSVGTQNEQNLTDQEREWIEGAMETARELGGRIIRYRGGDVASEILRYARQHNVTMIMLGKPRGLDIFFSPVYRIMVQSKGVDLFLFEPKKPINIPIRRRLPQLLSVDFAVSTVLIGLVTISNYLLRGLINPSNLLIIQLLPVLVTALFLRRGTAIATAIVSIVIFDLMFVEPYYTLSVSDWQYFISFIGYVVIAFIISSLATRLRYLLPQIWRSEAKAEAITALSHDLINIKGRKEIFSRLYQHMRLFGEGSFAIFVPGIGGMHIEAGDSEYPYSPKEVSIAQWVYDNGRDAGVGSDTLPSGKGYYVPLKVHRVVYGVLAFAFKNPAEILTPENKEILQTMAYLGALAIERVE